MKKAFHEIGFRARTHQQPDWRYQRKATRHDLHKSTDIMALCCYFDRVARTLTLGEEHVGLVPAAQRQARTETLSLCCYGVGVHLADETGLGLCRRLRETLAPEYLAPSQPAEVSVSYVVTASTRPGQPGESEFLIACDDAPVFATSEAEELYWWLRRDIDLAVARRAPTMLFVHAGVVGWRGVGIVVTGAGSVGKSMLVAELVRRGAIYYSDTFAVLDGAGRVHPFRRLMGAADHDYPQTLRLMREDGQVDPLPIGLVVDGAYTPGLAWRPSVVRGPRAALPLAENTVLAREQAAPMPQLAAKVAAGAVGLRGPRGEAEQAAALLLDVVDDALVSRALDAAGDNRTQLADELARVASSRLRSSASWAVSPFRRLEAARYVHVTNFLAPADHQRLLQSILSAGPMAWDPAVASAESGRLRPEASRAGSSEVDDDIWNLFGERLHAMLPFVQQQLESPGFRFALGRIEWQLIAPGLGGAPRPYGHANSASASSSHISCIYSFHLCPKRFVGGQLKLYDTWLTPSGSSRAETSSTLEPIDNSLVFFPSGAPHEISPIEPETRAFADNHFIIAFQFWATDWPAQASALTAYGGGAGSAIAQPAPVASRQATQASRSRRRAAVVVPAYRFPLTADEQISIRHLRAHLGEFDRYMIGPDAPPAEYADFARAPEPANTYVDRPSYNRLLLSEQFYRAFEAYEYILIYQLDCLVFSNALEEWCQKGYDFVGAPWFDRWHMFYSEQAQYPSDIVDALGIVGNGGFSLRKVDTAIAVLRSAKRSLLERLVQESASSLNPKLYEDRFWAFYAPTFVNEFRIPKAREALQFAFQQELLYCYRENGYRLPFGCHYWPVIQREFWEPLLMKA